MKKIFLSLLTLMLVLTGCATQYYNEPKNQNVATIQSYDMKQGGKQAVEARVMMIDQKYVTTYNSEDLFGWSVKDVKVPVTAGSHTFDIVTTINGNMFTNYVQANARLDATLKAGQPYYVGSKVSGDIAQVWIEDAAGNVISPVVSSPLKKRR